LWTIHPKYLDVKGLVALWREGLLAQKVLQNKTKGYKHHPQLIRFRAQHRPVATIAGFLKGVHEEALRRGYHFDGSRIANVRPANRLRETDGQLLYEWRHFKIKLKRRNPGLLANLRNISKPDPHPLFRIVKGEVRHWERTKMSGNSAKKRRVSPACRQAWHAAYSNQVSGPVGQVP
jgi:hypothetical protein